MNRYFKTIVRAALVGVAAFGVLACAREEMPEVVEIPGQAGNDGQEEPVTGVRTIQFRAMPRGTRAAFGEPDGNTWPTLWTENDSQLKLSLNYTGAQTAAVTPSQDYQSATFSATVDFTGVEGPYTYYAVSPASVAQALSPSREAWKVSIPCEQTPAAGSADEDAIILASASNSYSTVSEAEVIDLYFSHLTAYGKMSLNGLTLADGETVQAIELTVTTPIVGDWYWKCEPEQGEHTLTDYGASSTLTINTSSLTDIWFGCAPVEVSGEILVVNVYTSAGVYKKETLFPDNCKFTAGQVAMFSVNMSEASFMSGSTGTGSGSGNFELVTDASTLAVGDEVLIVCTSQSKAMGAQNGTFRDTVNVTIANNAIAYSGNAVVLTLEAGSTSGTWAFKDGSNYLASPSTANNYIQNSTSITANSSWEVSISSGLATIHAKSGSRSYLLYNNSQPRFTCYDSADKSGMSKVSIYRRSGGASGPDALLQNTEYGCYLGTGLNWTLNAGTEQVTRSYDTENVQTYTLIDPSEVEELEISGYKKSYVKGDSFNVTVYWRKGTSILYNDTCHVTLIKESGPKVWLSVGGGNGFIIKK